MPDFPSGGSNAQLPARDALGGPVVQTPDATAPSGVTPATRELRIRAALEHGGLRALPENFTDTAGDWQCVLSDDLFERLMLDWRLVHLITPDVVERHYLLLKEFWERIAMRMQSGADSRLLAKKYTIGEYASPDQVLAYPEILRRAQSQLSSRELIAEAAGRLDKVRYDNGVRAIQMDLNWALGDGVLGTDEASAIYSKGFAVGLTEWEIDVLLLAELGTRKMTLVSNSGGRDKSPRSGRWATPARMEEIRRNDERRFKFKDGAAASLPEFVVLADKAPIEAAEYLVAGYVDKWIANDLRDAPLALRVSKIIRERGANSRRALEMTMREFCVSARIPAGLPVLESHPPAIDFGQIPVGTSHRRKVNLTNTGRGIVWGTVAIDPTLPSLTGPTQFADVQSGDAAAELTFLLDATEVVPGKYEHAVTFVREGIPDKFSVMLRYEVHALDITISPKELNFGSVGFGASKQKSISLRWDPPAATLISDVVLKEPSEGLLIRKRTAENELVIDVGIDGSAFAAGKRYNNMVLIRTNSGVYSVPVTFKVALQWATVAKWSATFALIFSVLMATVRRLISDSSQNFRSWATEGGWDDTLGVGLVVAIGLSLIVRGVRGVMRKLHQTLDAKDAKTLAALRESARIE